MFRHLALAGALTGTLATLAPSALRGQAALGNWTGTITATGWNLDFTGGLHGTPLQIHQVANLMLDDLGLAHVSWTSTGTLGAGGIAGGGTADEAELSGADVGDVGIQKFGLKKFAKKIKWKSLIKPLIKPVATVFVNGGQDLATAFVPFIGPVAHAVSPVAIEAINTSVTNALGTAEAGTAPTTDPPEGERRRCPRHARCPIKASFRGLHRRPGNFIADPFSVAQEAGEQVEMPTETFLALMAGEATSMDVFGLAIATDDALARNAANVIVAETGEIDYPTGHVTLASGIATVPEPATFALMGSGLLMLAGLTHRRVRRAAGIPGVGECRRASDGRHRA